MASETPSDDIRGFDDPAPRHTKIKKKWIILPAAAVVVVTGASLIVPQMLDQDKYKALIKEKVASSTGYSVDWQGDIGLSLLPLPSVHLNEVTVSNGVTRILALKEADVRVELMPLLNKRIEIASVNLIEPDVSLIIDKDGHSTWMTDTLSAPKDKADAEQGVQGDAQATQVVLNALKITKGRLLLRNEQAGTEQLVEDLDADVNAESLSGPYAAKGDLVYAGKAIEFDVKSGSLEAGQQAYPVQAKLSLPDLKTKGEYSGMVTASPLKLDGELSAEASDLEKTMAAMSGKDSELPEGLGGAATLKGHVVYDGAIALLDQMRIEVGDLAYTGSVGVKDMQSDAPPLAINLVPEKSDRKLNGLAATLQDLSVKGTGSFANNVVRISTSTIGFKGQSIAASGTYALPKKEGQRPVVDAVIKADRLNLDQLTGASAAAGGEKSPASGKKETGAAPTGMSLPFDGKLAASIGSLTTGGKTYSPVNADIVSKGNVLTLNKVSVGLPGADVSASGRIGNLAALSDFDLTGSATTADADGLLQSLDIAKPEALKRKIGAASVSGTFKGSLENVAFNATVNALGFAATGQGNVAQPMDKPVINGMRLAVKHPQFVEAVRTFQPGFDAPQSFSGPLHLSTALSWSPTGVSLADLNGSVGATAVTGKLDVATGEKPSVKGILNFGDLVFDATQTGGGGSSAGKASSAGSGGDGRWSSQPVDVAWMNSIDADIAIKARSITQDMWKLSNVNLDFNLNNGTLDLRDVSAGLFGGDAKISGKVTATPLAFNFAMAANNVDARQLHSALTGVPADKITGTVQAFKVDLASSGASPAALINALNGKGSIDGRNIIVKGIDAAQLAETAKGSFKPLDRAGSLFQSFQGGQTQFDTMDVGFNVQNGGVTFNPLKLDGPRALIAGKAGNVSLPRWTMDLTTTVTVKDTDIPPFDLTLRGPLDNPSQLGSNVIEDYLRGKAQKKLEKVIGKELEKRFGIPFGQAEPTAPSDVAPATGADGDAVAPPASDTAAPAPEPERKQSKEEKAIRALQGLLGGQ